MWPLFVIVARVPSFSLLLPLRRYSIRVECLSSTAPESHRISRDHSPCKPSLEQRETSQPTVNTNQLIMTQPPSQSSHPPPSPPNLLLRRFTQQLHHPITRLLRANHHKR